MVSVPAGKSILRSWLAVGLLAVVVACGASKTPTTPDSPASTAPACAFTIPDEQLTKSVGAAGGSLTVGVTASAAGCTWTTASQTSFITVTSSATVTGSGSVTLAVAKNAGDARTGTVAIAARTLTVHQEAASPEPTCAVSLDVTSINAKASGAHGVVAVTVTSQAACRWTATASDAFITIVGSASGTANGQVEYDIAPNDGSARTGSLTIATSTVEIAQDAAGACVKTLTPSNISVGPEAKTGAIAVEATPSCSWQVTSNAGFLTVANGTAGQGNGTFQYSVAANPETTSRTGTLLVGGLGVIVDQDGTPPPAPPPPNPIWARPVPSPPPVAGTALMVFDSDPGDYIGLGQQRRDTRTTAAFTASASTDRRQVDVQVKPADLQGSFQLSFAAPAGQMLAPGLYEGATRIPFQSPAAPGLSVYGDGRGCNQLTGRFLVLEVEYGSGTDIERLHIMFEQHCEGQPPALYGEISLAAPFGYEPVPPPGPPAPPSPDPPTTTVSYVSDPGDYIGQGMSATFSVPGSTFAVTFDESKQQLEIRINPTSTPWWNLHLQSPQGVPLGPGVYDNATRWPFQSPVVPGLDVSGDGRGCNTLTGSFIVYEAEYGPGGTVQRFRATFEQHCEGATPALRGDIFILNNGGS